MKRVILTLCLCLPPEEGEYFLKVLIPSYAAGSIIGKGGQTIVQLQKETGATIKLSKSKDFYPGKHQHRYSIFILCMAGTLGSVSGARARIVFHCRKGHLQEPLHGPIASLLKFRLLNWT